MHITPRFSLQQTEDCLLITLHVPHIRVTSSELVVDKHDFTFFCKPFFLKLTLPHELLDDDDADLFNANGETEGEDQKSNEKKSRAVYYPEEENGVIRVELRKKIPGQYFPDLDLQTRLLQVRRDKDEKKATVFPKIEVLGESINDDNEEEAEADSTAQLNEPFSSLSLTKRHFYGFNSQYSQVLHHLREVTSEMSSVPDPDSMSTSERHFLRIQSECKDFDPDRYLADLVGGENDYIYQESMKFCPHWEYHWNTWKRCKEGRDDTSDDGQVLSDEILREKVFNEVGGFSDLETETMSALRNKKHLIEENSIEERLLMLGLVDILFAYCYDHRTTQGEATVESPYTIARLSPTLAYFERYVVVDESSEQSPKNDLLQTVISSTKGNSDKSTQSPELQSLHYVLVQAGRRSLIYPYLRMFKLTKKLYTDVTKLLMLGRRAVLRCLLQVRRVFEKTDTHYLLNKLYIDDYCTWLQSLGSHGDQICAELGSECNKAKRQVFKESLELDIPNVESMMESGSA